MPSTRRWYGFLYRLLGAGGSFLAWIVCLLGVYVTAGEALIWATNRAPGEARVADLVREVPRWRRWVRVGGVEIDLASVLFAARGAGAVAEGGGGQRLTDRALIDRDQPVALAWRDLLREIEAARADLERPDGEAEAHARLERLHALLLRIDDPQTRASYIPQEALVVIARDAPAGAGAGPEAGPAAAGESLEARWRRETRRRIDIIREAVRVDVVREGFLERLPDSRRESYKSAYKVSVATSALAVGHTPSHLAATSFAVFAVVLFFLAIGLRAGG